MFCLASRLCPQSSHQILTIPKILHDRRGKTDKILHEMDDILHETDRFLPLNRTQTGRAKTPGFPQGFIY
jgi:hypothetical protein